MRKIVWLLMIMYLLTGCGGVEPERRAYPMVIGIDCQKDRYQLILGMANLSSTTGQDKNSGKDSSKQTLLFDGENMDEILQMYHRTQDKYLDMGHIQAVIFGENLLGDGEKYQVILNYLENEPTVGDSAAVFRSSRIKEIMELNGSDIESLGMYLTGIYENRPSDHRSQMVTLRKLYRSWHEEGEVCNLPNLDAEKEFPKLSA